MIETIMQTKTLFINAGHSYLSAIGNEQAEAEFYTGIRGDAIKR